MNNLLKISALAVTGLVVFAAAKPDQMPPAPKPKLSDYGFFVGDLKALSPATNVFAYDVNAPLFSDYAEKARFIVLPPGTKMKYHAESAFEFPVGTTLIKNFYYSHEQAHPERGRRILETRLLTKDETGWKSWTYVWDDAQSEAFLEVAGATLPATWRDVSGKKQSVEYLVPNLNQCKGCHSFDGQFMPLGATARQLNRGEGPENQLVKWAKNGWLDLPEGFQPTAAPRLTDYSDTQNTDLNARARAYLDGNCGHCHNAHGPASTSGMFLDFSENNPERLGIGKPPVAAGRGSGNRRFGIVPGKPNESILLYRMEHDDPGIRMPELGRQLAHREGIELIKNWIKSLK